MPPKNEVAKGVEDAFNIIHTARVRKGKIAKLTTEEIPWNAFTTEPFEKKKAKDRERRRPPEKLHPLLRRWLDEGRGGEREELLVSFRDDLTIPRFPDPVTEETRKSAANRRALKAAQQLVAEITESRAKRYEELERELRRVKAKPLERFWLVNALLVNMPIGAAATLAKRDDVLFIAPSASGEEPPQNANPNDDVEDGRARIVSDPYFNLGLRGGWIGLLDTGIRFTHTQFNSPSHIAFRRDCVNGGPTCTAGPGFDPTDDCWNHGTKTAGIITGNANSGAAFRGVTAITLDSFKVYPARCGGLNEVAVLRAFQVAVSVLDRVIVAEMQGGGGDLSAISMAADAAFDAGAVVIAANGNNGPGAGSVNTPANAHRAIGVGNFDVQTLAQIPGQSRGPAPDGRYKPDIQAPTQTETASSRVGHRTRSLQWDERRHSVRGGCRGSSPELAPRQQLQHRPRAGLRAAHPLGPAAVPVQQHERRGPDPTADERLGLVGEGRNRQRRDGRHPARYQRGEREHVRRGALVARMGFPVPLRTFRDPQRHRPPSRRSQWLGSGLEHLDPERLRARPSQRPRRSRDVEAADSRVQRAGRGADRLLGRARASVGREAVRRRSTRTPTGTKSDRRRSGSGAACSAEGSSSSARIAGPRWRTRS